MAFQQAIGFCVAAWIGAILVRNAARTWEAA